jgi:hypothetical protein
VALTLIKEDGTGMPDANSYASAADGDAYHDGHLYATTWTAATLANKEKALVFATRLIDSQVQFNGWRTNDGQALQWPRFSCPDPDRAPFAVSVLSLRSTNAVPSNVIPKPVADATCEMARELLVADRTAAPPGEGIVSLHTGHTDAGTGGNAAASDNSTTIYSKGDTRPIISHVAQAMLSKFGALVNSKSGAVPLVRT